MSKEKYLEYLLKDMRWDSILIINSEGKLKRIHCPFNVIVLRQFAELNEGEMVTVDSVKVTPKAIDIYIIKGKAYYIWYLRIVI